MSNKNRATYCCRFSRWQPPPEGAVDFASSLDVTGIGRVRTRGVADSQEVIGQHAPGLGMIRLQFDGLSQRRNRLVAAPGTG